MSSMPLRRLGLVSRTLCRLAPDTLGATIVWVIGITWLALIAWGVWIHARESTQPPVYDAVSYYAKAYGIWQAIGSGALVNPLNVEPSFRPPGTVIMSYPFGFGGDFRGFYFRSVFFPILLIFGAVLLVLKRADRSARDLLEALFVASLLATPSLLFHFEFSDDQPLTISLWGMVDGFLTGLAALAAACGVRSLLDKSFYFAIATALVGVLMMFVKPAGVLLAGLADCAVAIQWLYLMAQVWRVGAERRKAIRQFIGLICIEVFLLGGGLLLAVHSRYLGTENVALASEALDVLRAEFRFDWDQLFPLIRGGLGPFIAIWITGTLFRLILSRGRSNSRDPAPRGLNVVQLSLAAFVLLVGGWFWLVAAAGITQIRYFLPFIYMAMIWALNPLLQARIRTPTIVRWTFQSIKLGIVLVTLWLLLISEPPKAWQRALGVDLTSGKHSPGLDQAKSVVATTGSDVREVTVYSINQGVDDAMFESIFDIEALHSHGPRFAVRRPVDWRRPSTFRIEEIISSDYLLFNPIWCHGLSGDSTPTNVKTFEDEEVVFCRWAAELNASGSTTDAGLEPESRLLKIIDRVKLRKSLEDLVSEHQWRDLFRDENAAVWWTEAEVENALSLLPVSATSVRFGQEFELGAVSLARLRKDSVLLKIWLRATSEPVRGDWKMIIHIVNARGEVQSVHDVPIGRWDARPGDRPYRFTQVTVPVSEHASAVAFGIYHDKTLLLADHGNRDWGGGRLLLTIPADPTK